MGLTGSVVNARPTSNSKTITAIWPARARMVISPLKSAVSASGKKCSINAAIRPPPSMVRLASPPGTTRPSSSLSSKSIVCAANSGFRDRHAAAEVSGAAHRSNGRPQSRAGADPGNSRPLKVKAHDR